MKPCTKPRMKNHWLERQGLRAYCPNIKAVNLVQISFFQLFAFQSRKTSNLHFCAFLGSNFVILFDSGKKIFYSKTLWPLIFTWKSICARGDIQKIHWQETVVHKLSICLSMAGDIIWKYLWTKFYSIIKYPIVIIGFSLQSVNFTGFPHNLDNLSLWGVYGFFVILTALFHRYCRENLQTPHNAL